MSGLDELAAHLQRSSRAPFLFVGAGLSRRYLKSDGWIDLLKRMAALTDMPYKYYATKANNQPPAIASEIAARFHEMWWTSDEFDESRQLFGEKISSAEGPLKVEVARYTEDILLNLPPENSREGRELELLKSAVIDGAITTNYDALLEGVFPEYRAFIGQDQLLFSDTQGIGEIYKIHGSYQDPESLVLTGLDYERFNARNPYLAAKLLTIFVEHPVLFLGYSLNDEDVTDILVSVAKVLTTDNLSKLQGRLVFVRWDPNAPKEPVLVATQIAASGFTIPVLQLTVREFNGVFQILANLRRKFPAQLLRQLKEHVYELVYSTDPQSKLAVLDIEDSTKVKDLEVVFGVGVMGRLSRLGYVGLKRADLLFDVLAPTSRYEPNRVVDEALPTILRQTGNTPIFRYLREAGRLRDDGSLVPDVTVGARVSERVEDIGARLSLGLQSDRAGRLVSRAGGDFETLVQEFPPQETLLAVLAMPEESVSIDALRQYLLENQDTFGTNLATAWAKAVCLYDYRRYAKIRDKS
jgi:hypothetical protein